MARMWHAVAIRDGGQTTSMRTTSAHQDRPTSAVHRRCLRSCVPAVVRPCCCTSCCTDFALTRQGNSVRLPPATPALLALASSSRSQVPARSASAAVVLTWNRTSVSVRWRPPLSVAIVTHFVTRSLVLARTRHGCGCGRSGRKPPGPYLASLRHHRASCMAHAPASLKAYRQAWSLVFRTFGFGKAPSAASFGARVEDEGVIDAFFGGAGLGAERGRQLGLAVPVAAGQVDPDGPAVS